MLRKGSSHRQRLLSIHLRTYFLRLLRDVQAITQFAHHGMVYIPAGYLHPPMFDNSFGEWIGGACVLRNSACDSLWGCASPATSVLP